jgi:hypothetical protein
MTEKDKPASIYTALRIPPDLLGEAKRRAAQDGRSLSNYIRQLIRRDMERSSIEETPSPYENRVLRETLSPKQIEKQSPKRVKYAPQKKSPPKK